ncbi:MAG: carbohydrate ABC transporter permease [Burkholderiales bacterium]|nr:carbohydrate ABC transporter permease [Burkholderiales bacterium]
MDRRTFGGNALRLVAVALFLVWSAAPIALVVLSSFKEPSRIFEVPPRLAFVPTLDSYRLLWANSPEFFRGLLNSLVVTVGATIVALFASLCSGYVFARYRGRTLNAIALGVLVVRMMPPIIVTVPLFPVINALGLNDTHLLLVALYAAFYVSLGTWMMRAFIGQIPYEIEESAAVDGASLAQTIRLVILPLAMQGMIALALFVVIFAWNEYLFAMIFTTRHAKTAPLMIAEMLGTVEGVQWGVVFAAATIQLLPVLALVVALQRFLVAGLTAGAVKS